MSFDREYSQRKERFDGMLFDLIAELKEIPQPLLSSITYSLTSGGKRLRPVLLLSAAQAFGAKESENIRRLALAVECVHTYSLIHDDLPCMDNSDMRRGKPTNHKVYGESVAVLAGDALLNLAYEQIFKATSACDDDKRMRYVRAGKLIADKCGAAGLIGGQVVDTVVDNSENLSARIDYIHLHKTADLICAAFTAGAIVGGAAENQIELVSDIGNDVGFAFQIVDDLIDFASGEDVGKCTFVAVYGENEARKAVADKTARALENLTKLDGDFSFIDSLIKHLSLRKE